MNIRKPKTIADLKLELMDYNKYFEYVKFEFGNLIQRQMEDNVKRESEIQRFIEKYPIAISGLLGELPAGYNIAGMTLISQPRLKTYQRDRQPDFLIITGNSLELYFNFIEIESPAKKFFHPKKLQVTKDFQEAVNQIREWTAFDRKDLDNYSDDIIDTVFRDNSDITKRKSRHYTFSLIYGDSSEIEDKNDQSFKRLLDGFFPNKDMIFSTYSRILKYMTPHYPLMSIIRRAGNSRFEALGMVPWKNYKVDEWQNYHLIYGKEKVVNECGWLSDIDKKKLINTMEELDSLPASEIWKRDDLTTSEFSDSMTDD